MPSTAKTDQAARAKARARRIAMDKDRATRDARIETNAAAVFTASAARAQAEDTMGLALQGLLADNLTPTQVADLCELTVAHVHKLIKRTPPPASPPVPASPPESVSAVAPQPGAEDSHK